MRDTIDWLLSLTGQVEEWILGVADAWWIHLVVYLFSALDGFFPSVPSESTIVTLSSLWSSAGTPSLLLMGLAAWIGAWTGDNLGYLIGYTIGWERFRFLREGKGRRAVEAADAGLHKRALLFLMTARYIPFGRTAVNLVGQSLPHRHFWPRSLLSTFVWAVYSCAIGAVAGAGSRTTTGGDHGRAHRSGGDGADHRTRDHGVHRALDRRAAQAALRTRRARSGSDDEGAAGARRPRAHRDDRGPRRDRQPPPGRRPRQAPRSVRPARRCARHPASRRADDAHRHPAGQGSHVLRGRQEFLVAVDADGEVVGCGAAVMWEDLAEVRTLAVRRPPRHRPGPSAAGRAARAGRAAGTGGRCSADLQVEFFTATASR